MKARWTPYQRFLIGVAVLFEFGTMAIALSALADAVLKLDWGFGWGGFFGTAGIFAGGTLLNAVVLAVNGVFDHLVS